MFLGRGFEDIEKLGEGWREMMRVWTGEGQRPQGAKETKRVSETSNGAAVAWRVLISG